MKQIASPNYDMRAASIPLDYIVLHYTGMVSAAAAMQRLCDPAAKVSAHYLIDEEGGITQLVDEDKRAWHAGVSFWRGQRDLNSASIGIELVNPGHEHGYRPFPQAQIATLTYLLANMIQRHKLNSKTCLLAHSDVAADRRHDPGEFFPWRDLAESRLGVWPQPQSEDFTETGTSEVTELLAAIGYDSADAYKATLAFQRRYHTENITGTAYPQTVARMRALKRLLT